MKKQKIMDLQKPTLQTLHSRFYCHLARLRDEIKLSNPHWYDKIGNPSSIVLFLEYNLIHLLNF